MIGIQSMKNRFFSFGVIFLSGFFLFGNIYFWTDDGGVKHYSNLIPPPDRYVEELKETQKTFDRLTDDESPVQSFKVLKVFDGDTLKVAAMNMVFTIRLAGIDAPEIGYKGQKSQPFSQKSRKYLESLVRNRFVKLKGHGSGGYNRQLAEVFLDGKNINLEMIRQGLAEVYPGRPPKTLDLIPYREAESKARKSGKGMWRQGKTYQSPGRWRRDHPRP